MTSEKIHIIAKAFFYTWLILAAIATVFATISFIARYILPEYVFMTLTFCWLWFLTYLYVNARAEHEKMKKRG